MESHGSISLKDNLAPSSIAPRALRVALVCMPFCAADRPSIQLGLLAAISQQAGFHADTYHLNLELAALIGSDIYAGLCNHRGHMTGEWLFSVAAFGDQTHLDDSAYFNAFPDELTHVAHHGKDAAYLSRLRHEVLPLYIDDCLGVADWDQYDVVGFTSTFQQNVASLALARRIKEKFPSIRIVFGGANMEDEMGPEYARAFPFIDFVVVGEGDQVFAELLQRLARDRSASGLRGLVVRHGEAVLSGGQALPTRDLDHLPVPDYEEYFTRTDRLGLNDQYVWMLPFESSRGCWWGQKHHCTFCGLNGLGIGYRSKTPERVLSELTELARRHHVSFFEATDNILSMKYVQGLFGEISAQRMDYQFFYEVKANLTQEQIGALHRGGVRWIQPGIESLSSHVLHLMRKGSTMLQNVRLLKWCRYYGIRVSWNLIWGFPGETEADYAEQLATLRLLSHLDAPHGCGRIWLERFSPYYSDREQFPVQQIRPEASYQFVYPPFVDLNRAAYFFDYEMGGTVPDDIHKETQAWVAEWRQQESSAERDTLFYRRTRDALFVDDNRSTARRGTYALEGPLALAYEYCSVTMHRVRQVTDHLRDVGGYSCTEAEVRKILDGFCSSGLMLTEDGRYLSLALPVNPNW